ncbi:CoA-transferase family III domain-containing protein [Butyriboletus roseoflavus]|nr:CoA-transferase family III domain-containing protein [Butyriboletus roseoflavus]
MLKHKATPSPPSRNSIPPSPPYLTHVILDGTQRTEGGRGAAKAPSLFVPGLATAKRLIAQADVLIDAFRPGVLERLGLGPEVFHDTEGKEGLNDRLIYARIAGFPREGPYASMAGHDINYIALSGVLSV